MHQRTKTILFILSGVAIVASAAASYVALQNGKKPTPDAITVGRADVRRTVAVTGRVKPAQDVSLAFERGGTVASVEAKVGDHVSAGQVIARLNAADAAAQLAQAQAALAAAQARLDSVKRGSRPEVLGIQSARVDAAKTALGEARQGLADRIQDAFVKADDAVRGKADPLFVDPNGTSPHLAFFVPDSILEQDIDLQRTLIGGRLPSWQTPVAETDDIETRAAGVVDDLGRLKTFLDSLAVALDKTDVKSNPSLAQLTLDGWKAAISLARANVTAAVAAVNGGVEKYRAAESALAVAQSEATLTTAAPPAEDVAMQEAAVRQAAAAVQAADVQLGKATLRSPLSGVVTRQDAKVGGIVAPNAPVAAVISEGTFEIEAVVPESDIASVKPGSSASVTLDAYGTGAPFAAEAVSVDPAESPTGGAPGYRVVFRFAKEDDRIKDGMTADVTVDEGEKKDVTAIPRQAVIMRDGVPSVLVVTGDGGTEERKIELGLVGSDGMTEVVSGLKEGERIAGFGK